MSSIKHTFGILAAGVLAFGAVIGGAALSPASGLYAQTPAEAGNSGAGSHGTNSGDNADGEDTTVHPLIGRWQAPSPANQDAYVEFTEYGLWEASDGCNHMQGTWSLTHDGQFVSSGGAMTLMGCDNVPIPTALISTEDIDFPEPGKLTLISDTGTEFELVQTRDTGLTIAGTWVNADAPKGDTSEVTFSDDNTWSGSDGCNQLFGTWDIDPAQPAAQPEGGATQASGPSFVFTPGVFTFQTLGTTQVACDTEIKDNVIAQLSEMDGIWLPTNDTLSFASTTAEENGETQTLALKLVK